MIKVSFMTTPIALIAVATAALAGCGGGGPGSRGPAARDPRGNTITTGGGSEVSQEAVNRWEQALTLFGQHEQQGWNAARCSASVGAFEEAVSAQGGAFTEALYMAGFSASKCNDQDQAKSFYERALDANGRHCRSRAALGVMQLDAGRRDQAFATFQRALRDDSRCTEAYVNIALIQRRRGGAQVREALNNLRRALAIDSNYLPAFNQMALLYLQLSRGRSNRQMLDLAGVVCRQAQLIDRDYAPIYNTWGLIAVRQDNIIEALRFFERATRLDNDMFEAFMNFGELNLPFRGYEAARDAFRRALELKANSYEAHIGLGMALRGLRQMDEAQREYERARELDGSRPEAYFNLGLLSQDYRSGSSEDLERAKALYAQFIQRAGDNDRFATATPDIQRRCRQRRRRGRRHRRRSTDCRPGRVQNIDTALEAMAEMAQMQELARQNQARQAEQERREREQQQAPEGGATE